MWVKFMPYQLVSKVGAASMAAQPASFFITSFWPKVTSERLTLMAAASISRMALIDSLTRKYVIVDVAEISAQFVWNQFGMQRTNWLMMSCNGATARRSVIRSRCMS
jgi:hypothetical protein